MFGMALVAVSGSSSNSISVHIQGILLEQHAGNIGYAAALVDNSNRVI
jgi:hypothetical protein